MGAAFVFVGGAFVLVGGAFVFVAAAFVLVRDGAAGVRRGALTAGVRAAGRLAGSGSGCMSFIMCSRCPAGIDCTCSIVMRCIAVSARILRRIVGSPRRWHLRSPAAFSLPSTIR